MRAKVAACAFARGYLGGIVKNVFQQLQDTGYFFDPVEREVGAAGGHASAHSCYHISRHQHSRAYQHISRAAQQGMISTSAHSCIGCCVSRSLQWEASKSLRQRHAASTTVRGSHPAAV